MGACGAVCVGTPIAELNNLREHVGAAGLFDPPRATSLEVVDGTDKRKRG